ncbi:MAG: formylglycine-generating enzyme family protein [Burkholderiaceae bacterium]
MLVVPAGSFVMGSPDSEEGHSSDESPQHRVTIERPFAAGKYEVTIAQWNACIADAGCAAERAANPGSDRRPVTGVSWDDAQAYLAWLSRRTQKKYRLLSESEWEYAARAGTTTPYHAGPAIDPNAANIADKQSATAASSRPGGFGIPVAGKQTVPVGSYAPNAFGLHDVHGNVWEWVEDCVNDGYAGAPADGHAWTSGNCVKRVLRGGSWADYAVGARSAIRSGLGTGNRGRTIGLRVARTLD